MHYHEALAKVVLIHGKENRTMVAWRGGEVGVWLGEGKRELAVLGDGNVTHLVVVVVIGTSICQNSLNCTLKMGAFNGWKLYLYKVDLKNRDTIIHHLSNLYNMKTSEYPILIHSIHHLSNKHLETALTMCRALFKCFKSKNSL